METQAQAQLTAMPNPDNTAPTGFRWKWLLYLGAMFGLIRGTLIVSVASTLATIGVAVFVTRIARKALSMKIAA